jgi:predicted component of type VI protein secretion system
VIVHGLPSKKKVNVIVHGLPSKKKVNVIVHGLPSKKKVNPQSMKSTSPTTICVMLSVTDDGALD